METNSQPANYGARAPQGDIISVKDWFITILIMSIPLVGLVMAFVWAFSGGTPISKANYFKAFLLWGVIAIILYFLFFSAILHAVLSNRYF